MFNLDEILEFIFKIGGVLLLLFCLFFIFLLLIDGFTGKSCFAKYENSKYDFWGGCLVEYK